MARRISLRTQRRGPTESVLRSSGQSTDLTLLMSRSSLEHVSCHPRFTFHIMSDIIFHQPCSQDVTVNTGSKFHLDGPPAASSGLHLHRSSFDAMYLVQWRRALPPHAPSTIFRWSLTLCLISFSISILFSLCSGTDSSSIGLRLMWHISITTWCLTSRAVALSLASACTQHNFPLSFYFHLTALDVLSSAPCHPCYSLELYSY